MDKFSKDEDIHENIGELVFETLLYSSINSITDLNLSDNKSWFIKPQTKEERSGNVELLAELISMQVGIQHLNLSENFLSKNATLTVLTRIAETSSSSRL